MLKYTQESVKNIDQRIQMQEKLIRSLKKYSTNDKTEFWNSLKEFIQTTISRCQDKINAILSSNTDGTSIHELKFYRGMSSALYDIIEIVEKNDRFLDIATTEMKRLQEERKKVVEKVNRQTGERVI